MHIQLNNPIFPDTRFAHDLPLMIRLSVRGAYLLLHLKRGRLFETGHTGCLFNFLRNNQMFKLELKGEVHSRMAIYFLYANKKFLQKYVIHQNFSSQRALNPYEIFL